MDAPYQGPAVTLVETVTHDEFRRLGGFKPRDRPLLVTGAVTDWPAWQRWSFERLADSAGMDASGVAATFQNGLIEQGSTRQPLRLPVGHYVRGLADIARQLHRSVRGRLCPDHVLAGLDPASTFRLDWGHLRSIIPNQVYLAQWDFLADRPELARDLRLESLWRWRSNWASAWIGPADTVTGLHTDYPNNWFCQFRGEKEFVLFPPENDHLMSPSSKYDSGSVLSRIDITRLHEQTEEASLLARASGIYARVHPGDALFVPRNTWHCVVALEPSISLSVFGLTVAERLTGGVKDTTLGFLHHLGWYRRGNCTCHEAEVRGGGG